MLNRFPLNCKCSPTFGRWIGQILSTDNKKQLRISEGFVHFVVLSGHAGFFYKTTDYHVPEFERSLVWNDPKIAIAWPLDVQPMVSAKDAQGMGLTDAGVFV